MRQLQDQLRQAHKEASEARAELRTLSTTLTAEMSCRTASADIVHSAGTTLTPALLMMGAAPAAAVTEHAEVPSVGEPG